MYVRWDYGFGGVSGVNDSEFFFLVLIEVEDGESILIEIVVLKFLFFDIKQVMEIVVVQVKEDDIVVWDVSYFVLEEVGKVFSLDFEEYFFYE